VSEESIENAILEKVRKDLEAMSGPRVYDEIQDEFAYQALLFVRGRS
jgi:hypothetical protein